MAALIGRGAELSQLLELLDPVRSPPRGIVFVAGEAGIGKSRLVDEALARLDGLVLRGEATPETRSPYARLVNVLRAFARADHTVLLEGGFAPYLAVLLPELGVEPVEADQTTLSAAVCDAAALIGARGGVIVLEDVHWADAGTLDLLVDLAKIPEQAGLRVLATYRNDELPRLHGLRRVRSELRRGRRFQEVELRPLAREDSDALAAQAAQRPLADHMLASIYERSEGNPFFIEELAALLGSRATAAPEGREDSGVPQSVQDAIRRRTSALDEDVKEALDVMAAAGHSASLPIVARVVDGDAITRLLEHGWLVEAGDGIASFRHALVRDAVYGDLPWLRRAELHRALADVLEQNSAPAEEIAVHWLAAREPQRARRHLLAAARSFCSVYAYRDAARLLRQAFEEWPEDEPERERADALELLAGCLELSGDRTEATDIWRAVIKGRERLGDIGGVARARRRLATVLEMAGEWAAATDERLAAAAAFAASAQPADAAVERFTVASHLQSAGDLRGAFQLVELAANDADAAGLQELVFRIAALRGHMLARRGEPSGVDVAREALGRALSEGYTGSAAEAYYHLAGALEYIGRFNGAIDAYETASEFCKSRGIQGFGEVCFACLAPVMRHVGRWKEATQVCRAVIEDPNAPDIAANVAAGELGLIQALRGNFPSARRLLERSLRFARANEIFGLVIETTWGSAFVAAAEGKPERATARARDLVEECLRRQEWHYSLSAMRWCCSWFASTGDSRMVYSAVEVVSNAAAATGLLEATTALSYALVEAALVDGNYDAAASQARQTLRHVDDLGAPYEAAEMRARCAIALAAVGERDAALGLLTAAYRTSKKLGARPLQQKIVTQFDDLGEPVEPHLGRVARAVSGSNLSRRELDVLRHVAAGRTNKEIGDVLFLSTRTIDMHMRNVLAKLECRSRAEAVARAGELGLLS